MTNDVKVNGTMVSAAPKSNKRKKIASLDRRKARAGWLFILPFLIGFVLIYLPMVLQSLEISISHITYVNGDPKFEFVWFENYVGAFSYSHESEGMFAQALVEGLTTLAFDLPAILLFSLFMAVMLNQKMAGRALFRSILFVPVVISTGVMETIQSLDTNYDQMQNGSIEDGSGGDASGDFMSMTDLNWLFSNLAVGQELVAYVVTIVNNIFSIVNRSGVQLLIFLAALQSVSPAIYESCKIDGATAWETFWKVTFPMISPMILVNAIYTVIDSFTTATNPVMTYISAVYVDTSEKWTREMSTAMSWMYFLIVMLIVALIAGVMSAFVFYQRKND